MSFLKFNPCVFVIGDYYEIIAVAKTNGIFCINAFGHEYYEENSGVLASEKNYAKIRIPQSALNSTSAYRVIFREAINRKGYFSEIGEPQMEKFEFKPFKKTENINIYHISDVHFCFDIAKQTASYFGDETDLFVFNGDIGEVETIEHYEKSLEFVSSITKGKVPAIYTRGNHDARGKLAEKFTDYNPADGKNLYYTFSLGNLRGVVLDCGEDKLDDYVDYSYENPYVYGGVNRFHDYRVREFAWLKTVQSYKDDKNVIPFAISHISPSVTTTRKGGAMDIERPLYTEWNEQLDRIGIKFMLSGHLHKYFVAESGSEYDTLPHNYPVVIGASVGGRYENKKLVPVSFVGTAIVLNPDKMEVSFTDHELKVRSSQTVYFK
ncbi:MAG: metallophosphoesterase [Clostridia bacterium]|nr:metallophosphoesterase [Clostridia bacterium]